MMGWTERLRLKELAEEEIYFAKRDLELVDAMRRQKTTKHRSVANKKEKKTIKSLY